MTSPSFERTKMSDLAKMSKQLLQIFLNEENHALKRKGKYDDIVSSSRECQ